MRVNGILSFLSFCDVCSDDCRSELETADLNSKLRTSLTTITAFLRKPG